MSYELVKASVKLLTVRPCFEVYKGQKTLALMRDFNAAAAYARRAGAKTKPYLRVVQ